MEAVEMNPTTIHHQTEKEIQLSNYESMVRVMVKAIQRTTNKEKRDRMYVTLENILIEQFKLLTDDR